MRTASRASTLVCLAHAGLALPGCAEARPVATIELRVAHERPTDTRSRARETLALASMSLRNARPGRAAALGAAPTAVAYTRALPGGVCEVASLCADERRAVDDALTSLEGSGR